jgi:hypothetical protein
VEQAFRKYLACGIFAHGFARARCDDCGNDFFVAFSCKGGGVCASCNTRRMAETAAHLADHVFPRLAVRQWVLSVPKRLRYFLQRDGAALNTALRMIIQHSLHQHCPGAAQADGAALHIGAVAFIHRFGSSLNTHVHFHVCVVDGVFEAVAGRGLIESFDAKEMLAYQHSGFSVDAGVCIAATDRAGLERLLRYCARPPFAIERLRQRGADLVYHCPKPQTGGKQADLVLTQMELIERIAALVPPPRTHRHRYFGVLAPNSPLRLQ